MGILSSYPSHSRDIESELRRKGYEYHAYFSSDKDEAKKVAKELRDTGEWYARVVPSTQSRKITGNFTGYSVFKRKKS